MGNKINNGEDSGRPRPRTSSVPAPREEVSNNALIRTRSRSIDVSEVVNSLEEVEVSKPEEINKTYEVDDKLIEQEFQKLIVKETVPMLFYWDEGGRSVFVSGTFNQWEEKMPLQKMGNEFSLVVELKRQLHAYKYIVDNEWRFSVKADTVADSRGFINNMVDLRRFKSEFERVDQPLVSNEWMDDKGFFEEKLPETQKVVSKEPPALPPFLKVLPLNTPLEKKVSSQHEIAEPHHTSLNHLCCAAVNNELMTFSTTERYRDGFITTVILSPW